MKWLPCFMVLFFSFTCYSNDKSITEQIIFNKVVDAINSSDSSSISDAEYDHVLGLISNGEGRWIDLYSKLNGKPFLGATSFQEGLNISMAYALAENPSEVLKFVNKDNVDYICGAPFIEPTQSEIKDYYKKARAKIASVSSKSFWKNKCLSTLDRMIVDEVASSDQ